MADTQQTRRRFLSILAAAPAAGAFPAFAGAPPARHGWTGLALGVQASITIDDSTPQLAAEALVACQAELRRLEGIFSLYQPQSALVRLNDRGTLDAAPAELLDLLARAAEFSRFSDGAFDATIQPVWALHRDVRITGNPPSPDRLREALALVDWQRVRLHGNTVSLARPGMAVTLNGIAQGYITDRVADVLRARGFRNVLIDLGEARALGPRGDGEAWRIGIPAPGGGNDWLSVLKLSGGAVATSGGYGHVFDPATGLNHILDPRSGLSPAHWASVTVVADTATIADALSTALTIVPPDHSAAVLRRGGGSRAILVAPSGRVRMIDA